jgi:hypothetical protein
MDYRIQIVHADALLQNGTGVSVQAFDEVFQTANERDACIQKSTRKW